MASAPAPQAVPQPQNGGHLQSIAERGSALAQAGYTTVKSRLPEAVKPRVEEVEHRVAGAAAPYADKGRWGGRR